MAKLTKKELEKIQNLVNNFNTLKIQLGDTVITQNNLLKNIEELKIQYASEEAVLIDKYGKDSVINVQTGEISQKPSEEETE